MFTANADPLPHKKRALRGRRLVAVDIENIWGGAVMRAEHVTAARRCLLATAGCRDSDQVVVGTSHVGILACGVGWPGARLVVHSGQNGADLALLEVLLGENVPMRFDEVVLASGDGIFSDVVAMLGASGVDVAVISRSDACSRRLRMAAQTVHLVDHHVFAIGDVA